MRSGCEFDYAGSIHLEATSMVAVADTPSAIGVRQPSDNSPSATSHQPIHSPGAKSNGAELDIWSSEAAACGRFICTLTASCLIHAAVALYASSSAGLQILISEVGRNSLAMISSQGNNAPPNEMELFLQTVELAVAAENVEAASPAEVSDPREVATSAVKKQVASALEVIARQDDSPADVDLPTPTPIPLEIERAEPEERPVAAAPARLERSKLNRESKPKQAQVSAASIASAGSEPSRGADVDRPPRPIHNPAPEYPFEALTKRQTGRVVLRVRVGADGGVLAAEVHSGSGVAALDAAALRAVRAWRFESALRAGSPAEQEIAVPVRFVMAESK